jgi:hypothetical protein
MHRRLVWFCVSVLVVAACGEQKAGTGSAASVAANQQGSAADDPYKKFTTSIEAALGTFNDIKVFDRVPGSPAWRRLIGEYVPITVNGQTPSHYATMMKVDRPMLLPTNVQKSSDSGSQSAPYSVVGRMPASNPEVQWVFVVRQYYIKDTTDDHFPWSGDMAVIGHHPRTGATVFLQYYDPEHPKSGQVVVSPFSPNGESFWSPLKILADSFTCQRCHSAGPFIHSPWINQVLVAKPLPGGRPREPMVPSDPVGPYFFVDAEEGQTFWSWNNALLVSKGGGHLKKRDNVCTQCHRVAPDTVGLNENATRFAGITTGRNAYVLRTDSFQLAGFDSLHWMPPIDPAQIDYYAGQAAFASQWQSTYGKAAAEVNQLARNQATWQKAIAAGLAADVPRPPKQFQQIVVDRPLRDTIGANGLLWVLDSRMRANTDGDLSQWRFFGTGAPSPPNRVAPVVYRRNFDSANSISYRVAFVGAPRTVGDAGGFVGIQDLQTFAVKQGDYLGVVFINSGSAAAPGAVPFTHDDWAALTAPDGTPWLRDGSVTYRLSGTGTPMVGTNLNFPITGAAFRTYSFEFRNKI